MKLDNFNRKRTALRALKENFNMNFDPSSMDKTQTTIMLGKVRKLIKEVRSTPTFHKSHKSPEYLKLLFMEQALFEHLKEAKSKKIVFESESVEKSQVILAAQDMVDTVQSMYEDINDLIVKELPSLVDSVKTQIGVNESNQYNEKVTQLLSSLEDTLKDTLDGLRSAVDILTGENNGDSFDIENDTMDMDMDMDVEDDLDSDTEDELDTDMPDKKEEIRARTVGRELR
jgi:hypothetical protein